MSQDVVADGLNMIRNANKAKKESVEINRISNLLIEILKIMKQKGAIKKIQNQCKGKNDWSYNRRIERMQGNKAEIYC